MRINHNIPALNAHRQLNQTNRNLGGVLERLSSGKRINKAADDAAGMAISEKMKAQVRGLRKASQNTLDGISLIQTAEGAMNEVHSMLQRMRELAVQSANGSSTNDDRKAIQDEVNQLTSEVNRIANGTEFNTRNILRGNEAPNSNTTVHRMSTGAPAVVNGGEAFVDDLAVAELGNLTSDTLNITIDGQERTVRMDKFDGIEEGPVSVGGKNFQVQGRPNTDGTVIIQWSGTSWQVDGTDVVNGSTTTIDGVDYTAPIEDGTNSDPVTIDLRAATSDEPAKIEVDGELISPPNATKDSLLEAINNAIGDLGQAIWNDSNQIELKSSSIGGESVIQISGTAANKIFGGSSDIEERGVSERDTSNATGSFYFSDVPQAGSTLTIGREKVEFYDSSVSPYTGSNRPIDTAGKSVEDIVVELSNLEFQGIQSIEVDGSVPQRLLLTASESGFAGQSVFLEGTPEEFVTNLQIGPNQGQGFRLSIGNIRANELGISSNSPQGNPGVTGAAYRSITEVTDGLSEGTIEYALDVSTEETATAAITVYDNTIVKVAELRGGLGAIQNRLEYTAANLDNTTENLTAALSRIEDADMALEMSEYTKLNILNQAGTAMLAQANQMPQSVLQLLGG